MFIEIIENNNQLPKSAIFNLEIKIDTQNIGNLTVYEHPNDKQGGQVHIEIMPKWRGRWVSKTLKNKLISKLKEVAKNHNLYVLYSLALAQISPRLLDFGEFIEYNKVQCEKMFYYLLVN